MVRLILKNVRREIRHSRPRFFALVAIFALGAGFFAGLGVTTYDMQRTQDNRFDRDRFQDLRLLSAYGFSEEEVQQLRARSEVEAADGFYTQDALMEAGGEIANVKLISLSDRVNLVELEDGRLPQNETECVLDSGAFGRHGAALGETITLSTENDDTVFDALHTRTFTVVGYVSSPLYLSFQRGSSTVGNGQCDFFLMAVKEAFAAEQYTEVALTVTGAAALDCYGAAYSVLIDETTAALEETALKEAQRERIRGPLLKEWQENQDKLTKERADAEEQLQEAEAELNQARTKLESARAQITSGAAQLRDGRAAYQAQRTETESALEKAETELKQKQTELEQGKAAYSQGLAALEQAETELQQLAAQIAALEQLGESAQLAALRTQYTYAAAQLQEQTAALQAVAEQLDTAEQALTAGAATLAAQREVAESGFAEAEAELTKQEAALAAARRQYETGLADYQRGSAEYQQQKADAKEKLDDAQKQLDDARAELDSLALPDWYLLDRTLNQGAEGFRQDALRVRNIARVFPALFFFVAALVCMTTMTRMVDEQRTQMGTLKALGFGKGVIATQLLLYALSACFIGSTLGILIGYVVFPGAIWSAYSILYNLPALQYHFHWGYALLALLLSMGLSGIVTLFTAMKFLRESAAQLMRPAAPKSGRKVLLEHLPFLWRRLNFTSKVTARNLLRYKKRFFMTVLGISGCTALLVTGFGLRDSIMGIVPTQYEEIYHYDIGVSLSADTQSAQAAIAAQGGTALRYAEISLTAETSAGQLECFARVPEEPELLSEVVTLRTRRGHTPLTLTDDSVIISEKLANRLSLQIGDTIILKKGDETPHTAVVGGITEHYIYSYVYFTPVGYKAVFGDEPDYLSCMLKLDGGDTHTAAEKLLSCPDISGVSLVQELLSSFNRIFGSLNLVVYVLIVCASLLAFVVLYNLSNINITERIRELATIKVLGFYDREVDAYLYRENVVLTLIGCGAGLLLGIFLHRFVIVTAEVDMVMFTRTITPLSFLLSALFTVIFAVFVNFVMHFRLKKVDMTESLKSVE